MKLQTLVLGRLVFIVVAIFVLILLFSVNPRSVKSDQVSLQYNPMTEMAVTGVVDGVQISPYSMSAGFGVRLALRTDNGPLIVHVAPCRFLANHEFKVCKGDQVKIVGSKVRYQGADALIAREITRRNQTFIFRRPDGKPFWEE